jgi:hypothetical protein
MRDGLGLALRGLRKDIGSAVALEGQVERSEEQSLSVVEELFT